MELLERLQFEATRLGSMLHHMPSVEPTVRNADLVTIDMASVRASDHPASSHAGPNGMTAEHLCQLARYVGMSDRLLALGFFEHNPDLDDRGRGAQLVAQGFGTPLDGIFNQKGDHPKSSTEDYLRYVVDLPRRGPRNCLFQEPQKRQVVDGRACPIHRENASLGVCSPHVPTRNTSKRPTATSPTGGGETYQKLHEGSQDIVFATNPSPAQGARALGKSLY